MKKLLLLVSILALGIPFVASAQMTTTQGGTGLSTYAAGDMIYSASLNPIRFTKLNIGSNGTCLTSNGSIPVWGPCSSGGAGSGTISTSTNPTIGQLAYWTSANTIGSIATSSLNLTVFSFLSPNISQWTNNAGYLTAAITSLNGLTNATQLFATSTNNGGFGFVSSGSTHTLNLPIASATNLLGLLSNTDWSTFNGKQAAGNYITALTGDVTASGPGSSATTLATVNSNVGAFTNANITVNAKGLITAASNGTAGGGTGNVSTSTNETAGTIAYWTSNSATPALLGKVATSTLSVGTGILSSGTLSSQIGGTNSSLSVDQSFSPTWTGAHIFNNITRSTTTQATTTSLAIAGITGSTQCLHVNTNGTVSGTGSDCGSGSGAVSSVSNADGTLTISPTTGAVVASLALGHANIWTGSQMLLASTTIGQGTSSTGLTVNGTATTTNLQIGLGTGALIGTNIQGVNNQNGAAGFAVHNSSAVTETGLFAGANGDGSVGSTSNNPFNIIANNTKYVTLLANGNLNVGSTTGGYAKLTVWGNGTGTGRTFSVVNSASTTLFGVLDNGNTGINLPNGSNSNFNLEVYGSASTTNATTSTFGITKLATPAGSFLAVNAQGTVIATTTPSGGTGSPGGSNGQIQFNNSSAFGGLTNSFYNSSFGTLGFGTTTPQWLLQLASSTAPQLALSDGIAADKHWVFRNNAANLQISYADPSTFVVNTTPAILADSSTNKVTVGGDFVTGGTANKYWQLSSTGGIANTSPGNAGGANVTYQFTNSNGGVTDAGNYTQDYLGTNSTITGNTSTQFTDIASVPNFNPSANITSLGRLVGIGERGVFGNGTAQYNATRPAVGIMASTTVNFPSASTGAYVGLLVDSNQISVSSTAKNYIAQLGVGGVNKMVIDNSGNVGIGTSSPFSILHVTSGASATTTVSIGSIGLTTSKGCVNMNRSDGGPGSFYLNSSGALVSEPNYCR